MTDHPAVALMPGTNEKYESTSMHAPWRRAHLHAVARYLSHGAGGQASAILALGDGIDTFIRECGVDWPSAWESEHLAPAITAFQSMCNLELGGLDAGVLDSWAGQMYDAIGWDADLGRLKA